MSSTLTLVEREAQPWKHYGYVEYDVYYLGWKTPFKVIMKNGQLVNIVSDAYRLIPLDFAEELAEKVAAQLGATLIRREYSYTHLVDPRTKEEISVPVKMWMIYDLHGEEHQIGDYRIRFGYTIVNSIDGSSAFQFMVTNVLRYGTRTAYVLVPNRWRVAISPVEVAAYIRERHAGKRPLDPIELMAERARKLVEDAQQMLPFFKIWAELPVDNELAEIVRKKLPKIYLPPSVQTADLATYMTILDLYVEIAMRIWESMTIGIDRRYQLFSALHSILKGK